MTFKINGDIRDCKPTATARTFRQHFGSFEVGLYFTAVMVLLGALPMWIVARDQEQTLLGRAPAAAA